MAPHADRARYSDASAPQRPCREGGLEHPARGFLMAVFRSKGRARTGFETLISHCHGQPGVRLRRIPNHRTAPECGTSERWTVV